MHPSQIGDVPPDGVSHRPITEKEQNMISPMRDLARLRRAEDLIKRSVDLLMTAEAGKLDPRPDEADLQRDELVLECELFLKDSGAQ